MGSSATEVFVIEIERYEKWSSGLWELQHGDPKGGAAVGYLRAAEACRTFDSPVHVVSYDSSSTIADVIKAAIGEPPRRYSVTVANALLDRVAQAVESAENLWLQRPSLHRNRHQELLDNRLSLHEQNVADGDVLLLKRISLTEVVDDALASLNSISYLMRLVRHAKEFLGFVSHPQKPEETFGSFYTKDSTRPVMGLMELVRHAEEFLGFVGHPQKPEETFGSFYTKDPTRPLVALLYTNEDIHIASYVRTHFDALDKASGENCVLFIESPLGLDGRRFWRNILEQNVYIVWRLLGWTESVPYNRNDAYEVARSLGIAVDQLPCAAVIKPGSSTVSSVTSISGDIKMKLRSVFAELDSANQLREPVVYGRAHPVPGKREVHDPALCFLSHNRADKELVRMVAANLHSLGIETWFDEWEILPGDSIPERISEGMARATSVLVFLSPEATSSKVT